VAHNKLEEALNNISLKYSCFEVQTVLQKVWAVDQRSAGLVQDLRAVSEAKHDTFHQGMPQGSGQPEQQGNRDADMSRMLVMREEAARGTLSAEVIMLAGC
jgi:hypothetical protein